MMAESIQDLFGKQEELCPELEDHFIDGNLPMIKHPLVFSIPHFPEMNTLLNRQLEHKKKAVQDAIQKRNVSSVIALHERPYRLAAFQTVSELVTSPNEYWEIVGSIWIDSENIFENEDEWRDLLHGPIEGRESMMDKEELAVLESLPSEITVYRGYAAGRGTPHSFSWTLKRDTAEFFARRLASSDETPTVITGTVLKNNVIAYFDGRNESEIVALPEDVIVTDSETVARSKQ